MISIELVLGFLIVPALLLLVGLPMREAVGTS
jgi:uncharacterized membrane protein YfcA